MANETVFFIVFIVFIVSVLLLDLGVFSKKDHTVTFREALGWTFVWVVCGIGFYLFLRYQGHLLYGIEDAEGLKMVVKRNMHPISLTGDYFPDIDIYRKNLSLEYITGYLIEYALSVDNIFVMVMVLSAFGVKEMYFKKVLFWGVMGAIVMRFIFIFLGAALIHKFEWILYVFGGFLIFTGVKMFMSSGEEEKIDPRKHPVVLFFSKHFSVYPMYVGNHFIIKKAGKIMLTPLLIVVLVVEFTDLIFAVDSVPAIFSVTKDPYIVFFSNIFAIMGLRSMFFLLVHVIHMFHYLKVGLSFLLVFVGLKMLGHHYLVEWGFTNFHSLMVIVLILTVSIVASVIFPKKMTSQNQEEKN